MVVSLKLDYLSLWIQLFIKALLGFQFYQSVFSLFE